MSYYFLQKIDKMPSFTSSNLKTVTFCPICGEALSFNRPHSIWSYFASSPRNCFFYFLHFTVNGSNIDPQ